MRVTLLSTQPCHLCEQAQMLIQRALPQADIEVVDIGDDDNLIEAYGARIPVLRYGDREISWPFSLLDIRSLVS